MNFTREPLIETIITPKEGHKLILRSSKGDELEEFSVDAVEIVTFGKATFFRSLEKPKTFLVPTSDYEVLEEREARVVLKSAGVERVKIGGGREASIKTVRDEESQDSRQDKRRDKRKGKKKKMKSDVEVSAEESRVETPSMPPSSTPQPERRRSLIPPPATLIHEQFQAKKEEENTIKESLVSAPPPLMNFDVEDEISPPDWDE